MSFDQTKLGNKTVQFSDFVEFPTKDSTPKVVYSLVYSHFGWVSTHSLLTHYGS